MRYVKFTINALILSSAFCITVLLAMSVFNMSLGVNAVEYVVAGQSYGPQFDAQGNVEDSSEPPVVLYVHADGSLVMPVYPTSWKVDDTEIQHADGYREFQPTFNPSDFNGQFGVLL